MKERPSSGAPAGSLPENKQGQKKESIPCAGTSGQTEDLVHVQVGSQEHLNFIDEGGGGGDFRRSAVYSVCSGILGAA